MAIESRGKRFRIRFTGPNGKRIQISTGECSKKQAEELEAKLKNDVWRQAKLKEKPCYTWIEAVVRWLNESQHRKSLNTDALRLQWLSPFLEKMALKDISRDIVEEIAIAKKAEDVSDATVNRYVELIRAILRKAEREWCWIDKAPALRLRKEDNKRIRWLTPNEANKLLTYLPDHLSAMAAFSLATGLRKSNVTGLKWRNVDFHNQHAIIHADQAKGKKGIPVPLNDLAMSILRKQSGKHDTYVFVYNEKPITQCNTKAWRKALRKSDIENFRWHDLRHTWASWHIQNGTSLYELQLLGGWQSNDMVMRYAHLSSQHLRTAAEKMWYKIGPVINDDSFKNSINR